ncbi:ATP-binding protein [Massilia glaciei]|uniref:histidine kinase n=1 Tax=Massilia glaciei TaxID=1524097 RepID=A0A2U2I642_9BURK|nr:ATP-binding protein [Massilia glaciei]PWF55231.1 HAMP domain-containing protein [Massilia glaciei]
MKWALPRLRPTLFARLAITWCLVLFAGHVIEHAFARTQLMTVQVTRASYYLGKDLGLLLPMLDQSAPPARPALLQNRSRKAYRFTLAAPAPHAPSPLAKYNYEANELAALRAELGPRHPVAVSAAVAANERIRYHVMLADGSELTAAMLDEVIVYSNWGGVIFALQALATALLTWIACRQATRPLRRLSEAAELLGASMQCEPIAEDGPSEVARAAAAFNLMGRRIKDHLAERVRMLAAISHDLKTPIARMRLRADLTEDGALRTKLHADLDVMQVLVEEGIAYARSADRVTEEARLVDIGALLDTIVCDYTDAGHPVRLAGEAKILLTRPNTLRRIVINLADNALKFAGAAEIAVHADPRGRLAIVVRDRGPGIAREHLKAVWEPFYRVEGSRNRGTGGAGLGLAIARQLTISINGTLTLANRDGGGLEATLTL